MAACKIMFKRKNIMEDRINLLFYVLILLISHIFPTFTFLLSWFLVMVLSFFYKKNEELKIFLIFFLLVLWPLLFYSYLTILCLGVLDSGVLLLENNHNPIYLKLDLESFNFWAFTFSALSKIELHGIIINSEYFRAFVFETYFFFALFFEALGLKLSIPIMIWG